MKIGASLEALVTPFADTQYRQATLDDLLSGLIVNMKRLQIDTFELPLDAALIHPKFFTDESLQRMAETFQQHGITVSIHLPFMWCDPSSLDDNVRLASVNSIVHLSKLVGKLEPFAYVLHSTGDRASIIGSSTMNSHEKSFYFHGIARQARKSLDEICQEIDPARLCVENLIGFPFEFLLEGIKKNKARICFDVGHCVMQSEDPYLFLSNNLRYIKVIHLHDVAPVDRDGAITLVDHQPLGTGIVKGKRILSTLQRKRYPGLVIIEVPGQDYLTRSLVNLASSG